MTVESGRCRRSCASALQRVLLTVVDPGLACSMLSQLIEVPTARDHTKEVAAMRLGLRDAVAALLVAAIIAPYAGLLLRGRAPFVDDVQMMAAVAVVLGVGAVLIADDLNLATVLGRVEVCLALVTLMLGGITMTLAATAAGQLLLGALVTGIVVTWGIQLLDHAGYASRPTSDGLPGSRRRPR